MDDGLFLSARLHIADGIVHSDLDGESVLLNLNSGIYFGLDPVGTRIWHLLQNRMSLHEVLEALLLEYDVPEDRCRQDVLNLTTQLLDKGLLQASHDTAP